MSLKKNYRPVVLALSLSLVVSSLGSLTGCEGMGGEKQTMGTFIGGAAGGLAGSQFGKGRGKLVTTAMGAILGAAVGNDIGASLDTVDQMKAQQAMQEATTAPLGTTIMWNNNASGHSGAVIPVRDGRSNTGAYCREFRQTVSIGGQQQQAYGTACRQPDGQWRIVSGQDQGF